MGLLVIVLVLAGISVGLAKRDTGIESKIQVTIPDNSLLRDFAKIEGVKPDTYLVVYVDNGWQTHNWLDDGNSCPGEILGEAIAGDYYAAIWQNGKLVNRVAIPRYTDQPLELVYRNIEGGELSRKKLMEFTDLTGDGKPYELRLLTTEGGCGLWYGLVAGYDPETNQVKLYSDWIYQFNPDEKGEYYADFNCGNHGNQTRHESWYKFSQSEKKFMLAEEKYTPCN